MSEYNKYKVIRNSISHDFADFLNRYIFMKRKVANTYYDLRYLKFELSEFGLIKTPQVKVISDECFGLYSDIVMETLLNDYLPFVKKETGMELYPSYSFARIYGKGSILQRHTDRDSCIISITMNLGGDDWSFFIDPSGGKNKTGHDIKLKKTDMIIYNGAKYEHWREKFEGDYCTQVFFHYTNDKDLIYDQRLHLGLPKVEPFINGPFLEEKHGIVK